MMQVNQSHWNIFKKEALPINVFKSEGYGSRKALKW